MIDILTYPVGRVGVIQVKGRIDSINAGLLSEAVTRELLHKHSGIVLDLAGVEYISAAGLRVLKMLHDAAGTVHIAQPSHRVREVLQITGLSGSYHVYETQVDALHTISPITNAHTHLELGWLADYCPSVVGMEFVPWIAGLIERRGASRTRLEVLMAKAVQDGIKALLASGTTTVGDITLSGASIEPLLLSGLRGVVYVEVLGVNEAQAEERFNAARALIEKWRPKERGKMQVGLSLHAPYSVHPALWKKGLDYARQEALPLCIHVAESSAEREYLLLGTGAMANSQPPFSAISPVPKSTPIHYLDDLGALALKPLLIHAIQVDDDDIQRIKASGSRVVHCPRSNLRLRCGRMPIEKYLAQGVPVFLGTDGLCSAPSLNIFDDLEVAVALHHGKAPSETLEGLVHQALL